LLIAHGMNDRVTDPQASADFAETARPLATRVSYIEVADERHALLRRPRLWNELAAAYSVGTLFDRPGDGSDRSEVSEVVAAALSGTAVIRV